MEGIKFHHNLQLLFALPSNLAFIFHAARRDDYRHDGPPPGYHREHRPVGRSRSRSRDRGDFRGHGPDFRGGAGSGGYYPPPGGNNGYAPRRDYPPAGFDERRGGPPPNGGGGGVGGPRYFEGGRGGPAPLDGRGGGYDGRR